MARTDFTQEIDGALAGRNLGMRHYSEIARSGNGNMRTDLREDLADYRELAGIGEAVEELSLQETAAIDQQGQVAAGDRFRWPKPGEMPPFASSRGNVWLRKLTPLPSRKAGGNRQARARWVEVSKDRLLEMKRTGELNGMGEFSLANVGTIASIGIGLAGGLAIWLFFLKKRKKG